MRLGNSNAGVRPHAARPVVGLRDRRTQEIPHALPPPGLPGLRPVPGPFGGFTAERLWRMESTDGETTLGDTNADVFTASGTPDKWRVTARANGALVTFTDILNHEDDAMLVPVGESIEVYLPRRKVRARNATALANATLSVEAFYADPVMSFDAR